MTQSAFDSLNASIINNNLNRAPLDQTADIELTPDDVVDGEASFVERGAGPQRRRTKMLPVVAAGVAILALVAGASYQVLQTAGDDSVAAEWQIPSQQVATAEPAGQETTTESAGQVAGQGAAATVAPETASSVSGDDASVVAAGTDPVHLPPELAALAAGDAARGATTSPATGPVAIPGAPAAAAAPDAQAVPAASDAPANVQAAAIASPFTSSPQAEAAKPALAVPTAAKPADPAPIAVAAPQPIAQPQPEAVAAHPKLAVAPKVSQKPAPAPRPVQAKPTTPKPAPQRQAKPAKEATPAAVAGNDAVKPLIVMSVQQIGLRALTRDSLTVASSDGGPDKTYHLGSALPSGERIEMLDASSLVIVTDRNVIRIKP